MELVTCILHAFGVRHVSQILVRVPLSNADPNLTLSLGCTDMEVLVTNDSAVYQWQQSIKNVGGQMAWAGPGDGVSSPFGGPG